MPITSYHSAKRAASGCLGDGGHAAPHEPADHHHLVTELPRGEFQLLDTRLAATPRSPRPPAVFSASESFE
jgi:hypothetical protein